MTNSLKDELIQNYLLAIKENLERIVQRVVTEHIPAVTQPVAQPITPPIAAADLVTKITALKAQGWSWLRIDRSYAGVWERSTIK